MNAAQIATRDNIERQLDASREAVEAALVAIYDRQTADERASRFTKHSNGIGFSKFDAEFCTSLVQQIKRGRTLTPKQLEVARKKMKRYWRQLIEVMTTEPPAVVEDELEIPVKSNKPRLRVAGMGVVSYEEANELYGTW